MHMHNISELNHLINPAPFINLHSLSAMECVIQRGNTTFVTSSLLVLRAGVWAAARSKPLDFHHSLAQIFNTTMDGWETPYCLMTQSSFARALIVTD